MSTWRARFYDGLSAREQIVHIQRDGDYVHVQGGQIDRTYAFAEVRLTEPLGTTPRAILLADGARCEFEAGQDLQAWSSNAKATYLHSFESSWRAVVLALFTILASLWISFAYGIPFLAKRTADHLPASTVKMLGEHNLALLDGTVFKPSAIARVRQDEFRAQYRTMLSRWSIEPVYALEFRKAPELGANAFALPSGTIVITDELVNLVQHEQELLSVLAHETGHVVCRHSLRAILQSSMTGLLTLAVSGDASSFFALSATAIIDSRYSRELESEADEYAYQLLQHAGIPLHFFSDILLRFEATEGNLAELKSFLATHPLTRERIQRFQ